VDNAEKQKDNTQAVSGTASKDALQVKTEGTSVAKAQEISQKPPETYTRDQLQKHTSDALAEQGKKHVKEVNTLKGERDELSAIKDDREALQKQIDEIKDKDPEVYTLAKKEQELREREKQLTKGIRDHSERIKRADNYERDVSITKIVEEFEGGDFDKLKGLCETFNSSSEEQIRKAAETLWSGKFVSPAPETPPVKPYSGMTSGGQEDLSKLSPDEKIRYGLTHKK